MRKKIFCALFVLTIILNLVGCTSNNGPTETTEISNVNNIFISKNQVELGVGESEQLIATVSPGNAQTILQWSSSNSDVVQVDQKGTLVGKKPGTAVITVQAENGVLAVCTVTVKIQMGAVTGVVTYNENGKHPDIGADVILISTNVKSLPSAARIGWEGVIWPDGVYYTEVSADGTYTFNDVPVGTYYIVIQSENGFEWYAQKSEEEAIYVWGDIYDLFDEDGKRYVRLTAEMYPTFIKTITVEANETIACPYTSYSS